MRVLLREYGNKFYVWEDNVKFENEKYVMPNGGTMHKTSILAIDTKENLDYVICQNCGKSIPNNQTAIEAHFAEMEMQKNCLKCNSLREYSPTNKQTEYTKDEHGLYKANAQYNVRLRCMNSYLDIDEMGDAMVHNACKYYKCRVRGVRKINDIFVNFPGVFETQITVDTLVNQKYQFDRFDFGYFRYDLKCRNTLKACVNKLGIVDHFELKYRYQIYHLYYSKKYNKLFFGNNGNYNSGIPYGVSESKWEQVTERIASLYKEDSK